MVGEFAKRHDADRYFLSMFAYAKHREALWILAAFNYEITKTREVVSETQIGLIRLQWWQDALDEIYQGKKIREHEVVEPLSRVIREYDLPQDLFKNMIYAREFDLEDTAPANLEGFKNYADFTHTPMLELTAKILGIEEQHLKELAQFYTIIGLVRAIPHHQSQHRVMIPQDLMTKYDLKRSELHKEATRENLKQCVAEILADVTPPNPQSRYFKAMYSLANAHFKSIKKADFDPYLVDKTIKKHRFLTVLSVIFNF